MVVKNAGQAFGAAAVSNLGIRNGVLRTALPGAPLDDMVRTLDALASVPKTQIYSVNQMSLEREREGMAADSVIRRNTRVEPARTLAGEATASQAGSVQRWQKTRSSTRCTLQSAASSSPLPLLTKKSCGGKP